MHHSFFAYVFRYTGKIYRHLREKDGKRGAGPEGQKDEINKMKKINNFIQDVMVEVTGSISSNKRSWKANLSFKDVDYCCDQEVGALHFFVVKYG